jgi:hypothetical protein
LFVFMMLLCCRHGWSRAEVLQGWRFCAADNIARTPSGHAMVRTNSGSQPHSLAAQLLRWLQQEGCAVLSAAGAGRTLTALQAVWELQQQLEQQQMQLLVTPQTRSSRRPEGGRCTVYTLHCQSVPVGGDAAAAAAPEQAVAQAQQLPAAAGIVLQKQAEQQQQQHGKQPRQQQQQQQRGSASRHQAGEQQQLVDSLQNGRQRCSQALQLQQQQQQLQWQHADWQQEHHQQHQVGHYMPVSGMLQLADAIEQHQLQRWSSKGASSSSSSSNQLECLHWQQQGLQLQLPPQQSNGCSSSHQQSSAALLQQHCCQDNWPEYAELDSSRAAATATAAAAADGVLELEVRGSAVALSEQLELALQRHAAVCMPVVYDKQAAKLLEAAALLSRRWQQQQRLPHSSSGQQLVLQLQEGWVQRQSGPRPGLHVYVFGVPSVY